jgi:hypothetical protein
LLLIAIFASGLCSVDLKQIQCSFRPQSSTNPRPLFECQRGRSIYMAMVVVGMGVACGCRHTLQEPATTLANGSPAFIIASCFLLAYHKLAELPDTRPLSQSQHWWQSQS